MTKFDIECLNRAKELIHKDPARHYTIPQIAEIVLMSPTKLKTNFKKVFKMGLYKYLQEQRLEKGKYLLENTDNTLKEISRTLGYKYRTNFTTSFRKKYGISPKAWRDLPHE